MPAAGAPCGASGAAASGLPKSYSNSLRLDELRGAAVISMVLKAVLHSGLDSG